MIAGGHLVGFSQVEVSVVKILIAVLISLLMPVVPSVHEAGRWVHGKNSRERMDFAMRICGSTNPDLLRTAAADSVLVGYHPDLKNPGESGDLIREVDFRSADAAVLGDWSTAGSRKLQAGSSEPAKNLKHPGAFA